MIHFDTLADVAVEITSILLEITLLWLIMVFCDDDDDQLNVIYMILWILLIDLSSA